MDSAPILMTLLSLWFSPVIAWKVMKAIQEKLAIRRRILVISTLVSVVVTFCLYAVVSTTSTTLDWLFFAGLYLCISLILYRLFYQKNVFVTHLIRVVMLLVFGIGYLSGTIGSLGVGLVMENFSATEERWLSNNLIYKEYHLGNAISDYRGKRVELYRTISWLPFIEWRIMEKVYINNLPSTVLFKPFRVRLSEDKSLLFLNTPHLHLEKPDLEVWADTLHISR